MRYLDIRGAGLGGYVGVNLFFSFLFCLFTSFTFLVRLSPLRRCKGFPYFDLQVWHWFE